MVRIAIADPALLRILRQICGARPRIQRHSSEWNRLREKAQQHPEFRTCMSLNTIPLRSIRPIPQQAAA